MITSGFFLIVAIVLLVVLIVCSKRVYEGHAGTSYSGKGGGGGKGPGGFNNTLDVDGGLGEYGKVKWGYPYWAVFPDWYYPDWLSCNQEKVVKNCESECKKGMKECNDCFVKNC